LKILIVKLSAFGDIIHALPALDDLICRPEVTEIHWLVDTRYSFVSGIFPKSIVVHTVDLKGKQPIASVWQALQSLRTIDFDAVIDLQGLLKSALLARAAGHPVYGIDRKYLREKASGCLIRSVRFHPNEKHVVQQYRRVAAAPFDKNFKQPPASPIPYCAPHIDLDRAHIHSEIQTEQILRHRLNLADKAYVLLHPAGGWETKQLPERTWEAIARDVIQTGKIPVFSWGNTAEQTLAQRLAKACNGFALPERLNMSALCTLLKGAQAVVGADTGMLHLAAALDVPTITFWGPSASWRSAPLNSDAADAQGDLHWHIESSPACGPCFKRSCDQFICMNAIDPDAITRILHEL